MEVADPKMLEVEHILPYLDKGLDGLAAVVKPHQSRSIFYSLWHNGDQVEVFGRPRVGCLGSFQHSTDWIRASRQCEHAQFSYGNDGIGKGKVLFGTDYPLVLHKDAIEQIDALGLKEDAKRLLLRKAVRKVFQL
jgi:hypothetical protein